MPRFPATAGQALIVMVLGLGVGFVDGIALRSRWAMLVAPLASRLFFGVGRLATHVHGPTIDGIHLDTTYGIVAFGLSFVVPGALGLLPMAVGARLGAASQGDRSRHQAPSRQVTSRQFLQQFL